MAPGKENLALQTRGSANSDSSVGCPAWDPTEELSPENRASLEPSNFMAIALQSLKPHHVQPHVTTAIS